MTEDSLDAAIDRALRAIAQDRQHGAAELADHGLALLAAVAAAEHRAGRSPCGHLTRTVARRLRDVRPSMASLGNWAAAFVEAMIEHQDRPMPWVDARHALAGVKAAIEAGQRAAARAALERCDAVLTLSYSSTVAQVLSDAGAPRKVFVAEARPLLEGRRLVEALRRSGREVVCLTDAAIAHFASCASAVLIGADAVGRDGGAVNKIGSLAAALAARHVGIPLYVCADRFKLAPRQNAAEIAIEEMDGEEVWPDHGAVCRNPYFEVVPASLISGFLMETSLCSPTALDGALQAVEATLRLVDEPPSPP